MQTHHMKKTKIYIGLDVHKETIIAAVAEGGAPGRCARRGRSPTTSTRWKSSCAGSGATGNTRCTSATKRGRAG